jgi:hypothetical protein
LTASGFGEEAGACNVNGVNQNVSCDNNTTIDNIGSGGDASGAEGNRIALGVGIGIGVPTLIITAAGVILAKRKGWCC